MCKVLLSVYTFHCKLSSTEHLPTNSTSVTLEPDHDTPRELSAPTGSLNNDMVELKLFIFSSVLLSSTYRVRVNKGCISSPSIRQRKSGSQLEKWQCRDLTTQLRPLLVSPSTVLKNEENKSCSNIKVFLFLKLRGNKVVPVSQT